MSASIPQSSFSVSSSHLPATPAPIKAPSATDSTVSISQTSHVAPVLPAGLWLRAVLGFEAPFGFDRMPTVWG